MKDQKEVSSDLISITSRSPQESIFWGKKLAQNISPGTVILFSGDLGAGKTHFIKGIIEELTLVSQENVTSPTFVYMNHYSGKTDVYHFDLYRLQDAEEFAMMGFDEYLFSDGVACIEWSEKIESLNIEPALLVEITQTGEEERKIIIDKRGSCEIPKIQ